MQRQAEHGGIGSTEPGKARPCYLAAARHAAAVHDHAEAERLYQACLALDVVPDAESIGVRLALHAAVYSPTGRNAEALRQLEAALAEARQVGDRILEAQCLRGFGSVYWSTGQKEQAQRSYQQALDRFRQAGELRGEASVLRLLASAYVTQGRLDEAHQMCEQGLDICRQAGARPLEGEATGLQGLGLLCMIHRQMERACADWERALLLLRDSGDRPNEGMLLGNLAVLYLEQGRPDRARQFQQQALAIHREVGNRRFEARFSELTNAELKACRERAVDELERAFVTALLERHGGNVSHAVAQAVERLLSEAAFREAAGRVAADFAAHDPAARFRKFVAEAIG